MESTLLLLSAKDVAKERFEQYVLKRLGKKGTDDSSIWEFYAFLLKQAQEYDINIPPSASLMPAYEADRDLAAVLEHYQNNGFRSSQADNSPRGE